MKSALLREMQRNKKIAADANKLAANYLAFIQLASIRPRLRVNESTTWQAAYS
jgi:hypothetical protein